MVRVLDRDTIGGIEADVEAVYRLAGLDSSHGATVRQVFTGLGLRPPGAADIRSEGMSCMMRGEFRAFWRRGLSPERARWVVGHELGHWWYEHRAGSSAPGDIEARCDAFGAALCVPSRLLRRARERHGADVEATAQSLRATQSIVLLRIGEVFGEPTALVRHRGPIIRGADFVWPVALELAKVQRSRHPSMRRVGIHDEPRRVGVVAA